LQSSDSKEDTNDQSFCVDYRDLCLAFFWGGGLGKGMVISFSCNLELKGAQEERVCSFLANFSVQLIYKR
jgi:hypothetical protein